MKDLFELVNNELPTDYAKRIQSDVAASRVSRSTKAIRDLVGEDFVNYNNFYAPEIAKQISIDRAWDEKGLKKSIKTALDITDLKLSKNSIDLPKFSRGKNGKVSSTVVNGIAAEYFKLGKRFDVAKKYNLKDLKEGKTEWVVDKEGLVRWEKTLDEMLGLSNVSKVEEFTTKEAVERMRELNIQKIKDKVIEKVGGDLEKAKPEQITKALSEVLPEALKYSKHLYTQSKLAGGKRVSNSEVIDGGESGTNRFGVSSGQIDFIENFLNKVTSDLGFGAYIDYKVTDKLRSKSVDRVVNKGGSPDITDMELVSKSAKVMVKKGDVYIEVPFDFKMTAGKTKVNKKTGEAEFSEKDLTDSKKTALESRKALIEEFEWWTNKFSNGEVTNIEFGTWLMGLKSGMDSILRTAANVGWVHEGSIKGKKVMEKDKMVDDYFVFEHMKPAQFVATELTKVFMDSKNKTNGKLNEKGKKAVKEVFKDYEVAIIPKSMDNVLKDMGLQESMPVGKLRAFERYYNELTRGNPDLRSLRGVGSNSGKHLGRDFVELSKLENSKQIIENNVNETSFVSRSSKNNKKVLEQVDKNDKAIRMANNFKKPVKKARVFDFDDTVGTSKNKVLAGKGKEKIILNAEEFAKRGLQLIEQGWKMDFSDFNKVTEGGKGPLFELMKKMKESPGSRDMFILTARAPEAAPAIHKFLKEMGIDIPLKNVIGLGNSTGEAKAQWLVGKAAEGYNDFFFADDAVQNVKAVKDALKPLDVKSKVQQAFLSRSAKMSEGFNKILQDKHNVEWYKEYSAAKAKTIGASKGKFKFWIPPSAEDFVGLLYKTLGKGKKGDAHMAFYKEHLLNPFARAMENISRDRIQLMADFKEIKKTLKVPKDLRKKTDIGFTKEDAVRVYLFNKMGHEVPGLSKSDLKELNDVISKDQKLKAFAEQILKATKGDGYVKPGQNWMVGTITTDLIDLVNTTKRSKYLEEWQRNSDEIFSTANLNKLEALYGPKYREAMENILARMKKGKNRLMEGNRLSNRILDYINNSNGAIMFFNTRSAVLQTISNINFVNWSFNNPLKAGTAFANQPQYWKDFKTLMNSEFLLDRRNGLKININESEIADAAATSKNKAKAALNYILKKGYLPTQYADSFAIASGGATFYRNRIKDLTKRGMDLKEAEAQAMREFREIAEENQQSSRPDKISQQQASDAGRLILMFANTPMQYARIQKRAFQDLVNGRGDAKTNVSKIIYYGFVQSVIFNALQQALFAEGFDEEEGIESKKIYKTANSMLDSQLRGLGLGGQALSVGKNFLLDIYERSGRKRPEYVDAAWKLMQFSPPIGSKISKLKAAAYAFDSKKRRDEIYSKGWSLENPAAMAAAKVISATVNIPLDRVLQKYENVSGAFAEDTDTWQSVAMMAGWPKWQIEDKQQEVELKPEQALEMRSKSSNADMLMKLNKQQQVKILKDFGYSDGAIKSLKTERDRVKVIIKRNKKKYPDNEVVGFESYDAKVNAKINMYKNSTDAVELSKLNKEQQVKILKDMGYSDKIIKTLKTEADRVRIIKIKKSKK